MGWTCGRGLAALSLCVYVCMCVQCVNCAQGSVRMLTVIDFKVIP